MSPRRAGGGVAGAAALALFAVAALVAPQAAARAWTLAFVVVSMAPLGALALLMIGTLTRATWANERRQSLDMLARFTPWLWLLFAPVAVSLPLIYPWAEGSLWSAWLSVPGFVGRTAIALAGWTAIAWLYGRGPVSQRLAGLGLLFHGMALCLIPNDWILSRSPGWTTTDFPMAMLAAQLLAATSCLLLLAPRRDQTGRDLAGLQIAAGLGLTYLTFMAYLVDWYGDLPDRVGWWIAHSSDGRYALALFAGVAGGLGPILVRAMPHASLRLGGACGLAGVTLYFGWLFADGVTALSAIAAACAASIVVLAGATGLRWTHREPAHG